jgi:tRNA threonylcarbamoyladenosine biosynthesis protein TsaE
VSVPAETVPLPDLAAVAAFGARLARVVRPGDVIALTGTLGAGKTTLAREIIHALGHTGEVPSPTFTIIETYDALEPPVAHADFYRLEHPQEAEQLGLDDYRAGAVLIAEWPDHAGGFTHDPACLSITLEMGTGTRKAIVERGEAWLGRDL